MANQTLPAGAVQLTVNQADIDRIVRKLDGMQGAALQKKEAAAIQGAVKLLVNPIRSQTPERTRRLWWSVKVRKLRPRRTNLGSVGIGSGTLKVSALSGLSAGEVAAYAVGPTAPYRHLVIRGHRIVTPGGHDTGRRTRPNAFVDRAVDPLEGQVRSFIDSQVKGF